MLTSLKQKLWQWRGVWIATPSIAGIVILMRILGLLQFWEWAAFDQYMRLRPSEPADQRVVIVGIDEADVQKIGQSIIPDGVYAELLKKLKSRQPRAIGLDIFRDVPVEPGHDQLVEIFQSTPNLVGIEKVVGEEGREVVNPPPALKAKGQVGANDLIVDADNKVRRTLLSVDNPSGETVYSFGLYLALLYLEPDGITPEVVAGTKDWRLGKTTFKRFQPNHGGYVGADNGGYQLVLNYRGGPRKFDTVSMRDVLEDQIPPNWGRDRVILIGFVGDSFQDFFSTPYSSGLLSLVKPMAGVEVHANLTSQIISSAKEGRPLIKTWSESSEWVWIFLWSGIGAILTWQLRDTASTRKVSLLRITVQLIATSLLFSSTYMIFLNGWWIPVVPPLIAFVGSTVTVTGYIAHTASSIRKTFGRYLSDEVVANLLESQDGLKLGGKRQKVTTLTSDLRGFTALSESISPEEVVTILNIYLASMLDIILSYQGTIDKFMGDGILVIFGAPTVREDDAKRAVACGVAMQLAMKDVNKKLQQLNLQPLEMGIGINTGIAVVGNIGSEKHSEYTVIGNQINLAFRIGTYATGNQILISDSTLKEVGKSSVRIDSSKQVTPKGVQQPIKIYEVGGIGEPYNLFLTKEKEIFMPLSLEIPVQYTIVEGKNIGDSLVQGSLIKLSARGAEIRLKNVEQNSIPSPLSNIKLNVLKIGEDVEISEDIYAQVLDKPGTLGSFYIHFTFKPPSVAVRLLEALTESLRRLRSYSDF
ncbi:MAG TPA: adenylate/guanylate cyclase domain-containing protein [Cyanobacteria bacterium UBA11162]|nr:adenylate/guanylate cyclase domain-containing protein [Cyanobacteria bacterium UBA11162]